MSSVRTPAREEGTHRNGHTEHNPVRRLATETKASFKTTEFVASRRGPGRHPDRLPRWVDEADAGGLGRQAGRGCT